MGETSRNFDQDLGDRDRGRKKLWGGQTEIIRHQNRVIHYFADSFTDENNIKGIP